LQILFFFSLSIPPSLSFSHSLSLILDKSSYTYISFGTRSLNLSLSPSLSFSCSFLLNPHIPPFFSLPPMHIQINNKNGQHTLCRKIESHLEESSSKTTHYCLHATCSISVHYPSPVSLKPHKTLKNKNFIKHLKTKTSQNNTKQMIQLTYDYSE
jgi:hypothetical protein